ncbi:MAG: YcaO-like family protein [Myxococcaceae bacterium]|nr:YcaO-like family protein [Myxococcaceae bacterium]
MKQLLRTVGITRIADLTSLDRAGVRVACAIRPGGHVLQVTNGKGEHAELAAAAEGAELWAAEQVESERWVFIDGVAYVAATRLDAKGELWVPASAVWCPPAPAPAMGRPAARWTSNGLGAHASRERALLHGLLEVIERHALTQTLPHGWTEEAVHGRCVEHTLEREGFRLRAFDLTPRGCPVPVAGALLEDLESGPIRLTAGYAARLDAKAAVQAACEEAFQTRLTEVQGAREDVSLGRGDEVPEWLEHVVPSARMVNARPRTVRALAQALHRPVAYVELVPDRLPLHVVKVFVEGYRVSELLQ